MSDDDYAGWLTQARRVSVEEYGTPWRADEILERWLNNPEPEEEQDDDADD